MPSAGGAIVSDVGARHGIEHAQVMEERRERLTIGVVGAQAHDRLEGRQGARAGEET